MGRHSHDRATRAGDGGTIPTDTGDDALDPGIGSVGGASGVGLVGPDFGVAGNVPEPPGVDEEPVTIEDADDPDAIAHRGAVGDVPERSEGVGPEVRPPS